MITEKTIGSMLLLLCAGLSAQAGSVRVATNGVDSATCGSNQAPCRSINRAIDNADPGDFVRVGPGVYNTESEPALGCNCLILVDKAVRIESAEGYEATVLNADGLEDFTVLITVSGATLGRSRRGFTITGAKFHGLLVDGALTDLTVADNHAFGNDWHGFQIDGTGNVFKSNTSSRNGGDGFDVGNFTEGIELTHNSALGNGGLGFAINGGEGHTLTRNVAIDNRIGFVLDGSNHLLKECRATRNVEHGFLATSGSSGVTFSRCLAAANGLAGLFVSNSTGAAIEESAALSNAGAGIAFHNSTGTVTRTNIYGNHGGATGNCGLTNSGLPIDASGNFWGYWGGYGPDPADGLCGPSSVVVDSVARKEFVQPYVALL